MFKKDLDLVKELHKKYNFLAPLIDAGGMESPTIADYEISIRKAYRQTIKLNGIDREVVVPHEEQKDRYVNIKRPWSFIDPNYIIENPEYGGSFIEDLPKKYNNYFNTIIMVSVFEHVNNPYKISDCLFQILKPGGYLFNSTPFLFPHHPSPEDNFRFSPVALRRIHESSGFKWLEGDFHINYPVNAGIGDTNPARYLQLQPMMVSYALCRKE
ncbi:MAG: methyltransferase domain-containing protein [Nanoarchaeota archaeon]